MRTAAGKTAAAGTFAAAAHAGPVGVIDYATTHDSRLVSADGRTAIAIYDMPSPDLAKTAGTMDHILPALKAHAPPGVSVVLTGYEQLSAGSTGKGGGGPRVPAAATVGAAGALPGLVFGFSAPDAVLSPL